MALRLYQRDIPEMVLERNYPNNTQIDASGIVEHHTEINYPVGKAAYDEIYFEGVHIGYGSASLAKRVLLGFETDIETVEMHFALMGKTTTVSGEFGRAVSFEANQHNIIYANGLKGTMHWEPKAFKLCEINLSPVFFKKYLPDDHQLFNNFRNAIDTKRCELMLNEHRYLSYQMYDIIREIMNCNRKGFFKRMFLEAKVVELLLLQLEQLSEDLMPDTKLKKADIDKIYAVQEFMARNLDEQYSLIELAHQVGTNEFTLKKGFRELFGTTVFGYWNAVKMDHAKILLLEQDMPVSEVSDYVGYKNSRHFSTAFKRKFGILPSQIKKSSKS